MKQTSNSILQNSVSFHLTLIVQRFSCITLLGKSMDLFQITNIEDHCWLPVVPATPFINQISNISYIRNLFEASSKTVSKIQVSFHLTLRVQQFGYSISMNSYQFTRCGDRFGCYINLPLRIHIKVAILHRAY